jgi:hypothetical protein
MGGWPAGYQAVAIDLDILTGAPSDLGSYLTYNGAAELFRYAAEAPIMESYGNETHKIEKNVTFISHYYDIVRGSGIITANSITNLDGEPLPYGQIAVNGDVMKLTEDSVSVGDLIGHSVELFPNRFYGHRLCGSREIIVPTCKGIAILFHLGGGNGAVFLVFL